MAISCRATIGLEQLPIWAISFRWLPAAGRGCYLAYAGRSYGHLESVLAKMSLSTIYCLDNGLAWLYGHMAQTPPPLPSPFRCLALSPSRTLTAQSICLWCIPCPPLAVSQSASGKVDCVRVQTGKCKCQSICHFTSKDPCRCGYLRGCHSIHALRPPYRHNSQLHPSSPVLYLPCDCIEKSPREQANVARGEGEHIPALFKTARAHSNEGACKSDRSPTEKRQGKDV